MGLSPPVERIICADPKTDQFQSFREAFGDLMESGLEK
jgi:hypothetical protein